MIKWFPVILAIAAVFVVAINIYISGEEKKDVTEKVFYTPVERIVDNSIPVERIVDNDTHREITSEKIFNPPSHVLSSGVIFDPSTLPQDELTKYSTEQMEKGQKSNRNKRMKYRYEKMSK